MLHFKVWFLVGDLEMIEDLAKEMISGIFLNHCGVGWDLGRVVLARQFVDPLVKWCSRWHVTVVLFATDMMRDLYANEWDVP